MVNEFFVTKLGMTQAWTKAGKRLAVTRCQAIPNAVVSATTVPVVNRLNHTKQIVPVTILEIGYGKKKLKNVAKPLRTKLEKSGFSFGVANVRGVRVPIETSTAEEETVPIKAGDELKLDQVLEVGDLVFTPAGTICEGRCLLQVEPKAKGELFEASGPGQGRFVNVESAWSSFVRVSRRCFVGRSVYRHLEEVSNG